MIRVERNLYQHENGNYYAIFEGVPRSLGTKKVSEARRLLSSIRRERVTAANGKNVPSPVPVVTEAEVPTPSNEMAELKAMIASLATQVTQLAAAGRPAVAQDGSPLAAAPALSFEDFAEQNLGTACAPVKKKTKTMYQGGERRLMKTLRAHQRLQCRKALKATGEPAAPPDLWEIFRNLGPERVWSHWTRERGKKGSKKVRLGPSGLNHFRSYLVRPSRSLTALNTDANLVFKGTVTETKEVTPAKPSSSPSFFEMEGSSTFAVSRAQFKIVSLIKGAPQTRVASGSDVEILRATARSLGFGQRKDLADLLSRFLDAVMSALFRTEPSPKSYGNGGNPVTTTSSRATSGASSTPSPRHSRAT